MGPRGATSPRVPARARTQVSTSPAPQSRLSPTAERGGSLAAIRSAASTSAGSRSRPQPTRVPPRTCAIAHSVSERGAGRSVSCSRRPAAGERLGDGGVVPIDPARAGAARSDSPKRRRPDRGLRRACDGRDSPASGDGDALLLIGHPSWCLDRRPEEGQLLPSPFGGPDEEQPLPGGGEVPTSGDRT